jgi:hypothetical protein
MFTTTANGQVSIIAPAIEVGGRMDFHYGEKKRVLIVATINAEKGYVNGPVITDGEVSDDTPFKTFRFDSIEGYVSYYAPNHIIVDTTIDFLRENDVEQVAGRWCKTLGV